MKTAPMMVVMVSCTASRPYTFLMNPVKKIEVSHMSSAACNIQSLTQPHVLAGPSHVVVEGEVILETSLDPLAGAAPLLLTLEIEDKTLLTGSGVIDISLTIFRNDQKKSFNIAINPWQRQLS